MQTTYRDSNSINWLIEKTATGIRARPSAANPYGTEPGRWPVILASVDSGTKGVTDNDVREAIEEYIASHQTAPNVPGVPAESTAGGSWLWLLVLVGALYVTDKKRKG